MAPCRPALLIDDDATSLHLSRRAQVCSGQAAALEGRA